VLASPDGLALVRADARLDVDLHPSIAARVRSQFLLGEYELAAFAALRQVEIRVRELAGADDADVEVKLMTKAYNDKGPLRDPASEGGEQVAMMNLFQGGDRGVQEPAVAPAGRLRRPDAGLRDRATRRPVASVARFASHLAVGREAGPPGSEGQMVPAPALLTGCQVSLLPVEPWGRKLNVGPHSALVTTGRRASPRP
jgi:hypothetical protein